MPQPDSKTLPAESYRHLLKSARAGDHSARTRMYLDYGPYFRRIIQSRLKIQHLSWATTPHDIFNSVMLRVWEDDILNVLDSEEQFLKYVSRAIAWEVRDVWRNLRARRRDYRRQEALAEYHGALAARDGDPVHSAAIQDGLNAIRARLTAESREVLDLWLAGEDWIAIGTKLGRNADLLRKRLERSLTLLRNRFTEPG